MTFTAGEFEILFGQLPSLTNSFKRDGDILFFSFQPYVVSAELSGNRPCCAGSEERVEYDIAWIGSRCQYPVEKGFGFLRCVGFFAFNLKPFIPVADW